ARESCGDELSFRQRRDCRQCVGRDHRDVRGVSGAAANPSIVMSDMISSCKFAARRLTQRRYKTGLLALAIVCAAQVDVGARESKDWIILENCRLISNRANDGDSFHASAGAREYIFRLYMVDAPETDEMNPARLVEQAKIGGWGVDAGRLNVHAQKPAPFNVFVTGKTARSHAWPPANTPFATPVFRPSSTTVGPVEVKKSHAKEKIEPGRIDINAATEKELKMIPGVGQVMASRIIAARPFRSADDLKKVSGIG